MVLSRITLPFLAITFICLSFSGKDVEAASINGGYQAVNSNSIVFRVNIGTPAPSSLIVQHFHPPGIAVAATSPAAGKISSNSGYTKWFLKNPRPGTYTFSIRLGKSVSPSSLSLILRYKDPSTGSFRELSLRP